MKAHCAAYCSLASFAFCTLVPAMCADAQTIVMQPSVNVSSYTEVQAVSIVENLEVDSCNQPYEVREESASRTSNVNGNTTITSYGFCRVNLTNDIYYVNETPYVWMSPGSPNTVVKCVGSCVEAEPDPPEMPIQPPFPLPPLPCVVDDIDLCTTSASSHPVIYAED